MLTVITACYNAVSRFGKNRVARCIESVYSLPFEHEHLIMDGGSSDGSLEFISNMDIPSLRLYSEEDHGIYEALNKGIAKSVGDFIYVLGLDDYVESPENMTLAYNFAIAGNYDVIISPVKLSNGAIVPVKRKDIFNIYYKMAFCHQGVLCRRVVLLNQKGYSTGYKFISDWLSSYKAIYAGNKVKYFGKNFSVYGLTGYSSSQIALAENEQLEHLMKIYPRAREDLVIHGIIPILDIFKLLLNKSLFARKCGLRALQNKIFLKVKSQEYKTYFILGLKVLTLRRLPCAPEHCTS